MYYLAALVTALFAIGAWNTSTVPFIRKNGEDVEAGYMGWLIDIFTHFFFALVIGFSYKRRIPAGVYVHGLGLVVTIVFLVLATRKG
jgi:hypothetical protein